MNPIRVELQLIDGSFVTGALRAGQTLNSLSQQLTKTGSALNTMAAQGQNVITSVRKMDDANKSALSTLRDISVVAGFASMAIGKLAGVSNSWIGQIVKVNAELERLTFQMRAMARSGDAFKEAAENVDYLREQATKMPFSLQTLTQGFSKMKSTGIDPMNGSLKALADGVAAFGGNDDAFNRVVLAVTQMKGKSVIQMEEMRQQMGEVMPRAMELMARSMGISVAELTKVIGTGMLDATPALNKFFAEIERSFGGTAGRMMETFSGQIAKMKTSFQLLATGEGGSKFFEEVKSQLADLNQFLSSDRAKLFAKDVGEALTSVVRGFRSAVDFIIEFRSEIYNVGVTFAAVFGASKMVGMVAALTAAFSANLVQLRMLRTNIVAASADIALGMSGLRSMSTVTTGLGVAAMGARSLLTGLAAGIGAVAPWVAILGTGVYLAGQQFGWFSDKVGEAYDNLVKYGAETRKQAREGVEAKRKSLQAQIEEIQAEEDRYKASRDQFDPSGSQGFSRGYMLPGLRKELEALNKGEDAVIGEAGIREDAKIQQVIQNMIAARVDDARKLYDREGVELSQWYDTEREKAIEQGTSLEKVKLEYAEKLRAITKKLYQTELKVIRDSIDEQRAITKTGSADEIAAANAKITALSILRTNALNKIDKLPTEFAGPELFAGSPEKAQGRGITRGEEVVKTLTEDIAKLNAQMTGASGAAAEMFARIANGDFGSIKMGGEAVQELHDKLVRLAQEKEALDKAARGQQKLDNDLANNQAKIEERRMELLFRQQGKVLTEAEKIQIKLQNGFYAGLGPIDKIRASLGDVVTTMIAQGNVSNQVANVLQKNTFGSPTMTALDNVNSALKTVAETLNLIGTNANNISFSNLTNGLSGIGTAIGGGGGNAPFVMGSNSGSILDLIAKRESGGDYNMTLDNGQWTGGRRNLVSMTLNEIVALQRSMLTPANRAKYGNGQGSSALGRYQIVGKTLRGLIQSMGLSGNELYDPAMQDRLARELLRQRQGQGVAGLRSEWEGLKGVPDDVILAALKSSTTGPTVERAAGINPPGTTGGINPSAAGFSAPFFDSATAAGEDYNRMMGRGNAVVQERQTLEQNRVAATARAMSDADKQKVEEVNLGKGEKDADMKDYLDAMKERAKNAAKEVDELGKNYAQLVKDVSAGKFGEDKNINSDRYKELVRAAKELDRIEESTTKTRRLKREVTAEEKKLDDQRLDLNRQIAEAQAKAKNPNYKGESDELRRLTLQMDDYINKVKELYGGDSAEYKAALAQRSSLLGQQNQLEVTNSMTKMRDETRTLQEGLLTQGQQREAAYQRELARLDAWADQMRRQGAKEVDITREVEARKAALRQQYAQTNPTAKMMTEWSDLQGKLADGAAQWTDSIAGGLADLAMGTNNFRSILNGILKDMLNMGIKYMLSSMKNGKGGAAGAVGKGGGKAGGGGGGKGILSIFSKGAAGVRHSGGMASVGGVMRNVSMANFIGAPRFHTGGIIGKDEVPIIAQRKEGVFTPEQMKSLAPVGAGSQAITINTPITVNASGGTPEQNDDMAKRMSKEIEASMRAVVVDEVIRQMRPGNALSKAGVKY